MNKRTLFSGFGATFCMGVFAALLAWGAGPAAAQAPAAPAASAAAAARPAPAWPRRPFFAVDSKAHSDEAVWLALTPDDQRAVTVAYDGSLRVWDVQSGELLQRFFLPRLSQGSTRLRGIAMAPDGQRVAVTGFDFRRAIVVVSLQTGRIEKTITGTEDTLSLAWSPDGRFIAGGKPLSAPRKGVRVYDVQSGAEVFSDTEFAGELSGLEFRADGALMAASWEPRGNASVVKIYKPQGAGYALAVQRTPPFGASRAQWDSAGKSVLMGAVARLDGETLADMPYELDRRNLPPNVGVARVRQSPDGTFYYGATWSRYASSGYLRRWTGTRRIDPYTQVQLPDAQIVSLAITRKGETVYLSEQGTVGMVDADLKLAWRNAHDAAAFDGKPGALRVTDAGMVALPVRTGSTESEIAFNLAAPEFVPVARVQGRWQAPATSGAGIRVLAWEGTTVGTVNNANLPFVNPGERSLCIAVHSSDGTLAMGSSSERLYKVSAKGERLWVKYLGSDVMAVNLIESRDLLVAATANGMLRVYRWSTGEPVLSYYLQPSSKRWIAVTGEGYYEAGVGAEDLAGWIVNPPDARVADFMPMSRFRSSLLLGGLGRQAWESRKEADAVKALLAQRPPVAAANKPAAAVVAAPAAPAAPAVPAAPAQPQAPAVAVVPAPVVPADSTDRPAPEQAASAVRLDEIPPRIELLAPGYQVSTDARQVRIRFKALSPQGAPITQVRSFVASTSVASRSVGAPAAAAEERELTVDIPPEDTEIRLIAENRFGASVPTVIRVSYTGARQQAGKGNLYVLAAGVSKYDNPQYNLGLAAKDARDFVDTLQRQKGALYGDVVVRLLQDKAASKADVEAGFAWLKQVMTPRDTAIVFFAGHGFNDGPVYYFVTRDADLDRLPQTAVPFNTIRAAMTSLPGRALIFVDTCHSGNVIGKAASRQARDSTAAINDLASSENGLVVFASSTGGQLSQEDPAWGNGAFTKAVVEGLLGAADFKKRGRITYKGLDAYVSDRVDELTKGEQTPVTPVLQGVPDFAIAEVRR